MKNIPTEKEEKKNIPKGRERGGRSGRGRRKEAHVTTSEKEEMVAAGESVRELKRVREAECAAAKK